jgi:hypothetical protein
MLKNQITDLTKHQSKLKLFEEPLGQKYESGDFDKKKFKLPQSTSQAQLEVYLKQEF